MAFKFKVGQAVRFIDCKLTDTALLTGQSVLYLK